MLEMLNWLQGISAWPDRCAVTVLEWLIELWADPTTQESVRSEIIETSRLLVASLRDDEATEP